MTVKIDAESYEEMRAWFARVVRETFPADLLTAETDPVRCLDQLATQSPAKARQGLAMAIGDMVEAAECWPHGKVAAIDAELANKGLPSLTDVRLRFSKAIARVVKRGAIKSEVEYYAVRNVVDLADDNQEALWKLLSAYEQRLSG